ncbi:hypothetical protein AB0B30_04450 [Streptomyces narbonensis]|uniref:Uncharacterized protein n=1 Tax=Streptomyces narbonensis TaxID=67333 RepID=A0ABV3C5F2_9ACTN
MRRPVEGEVHVSYGQLYVTDDSGEQPELHESFAGQVSGLCGAAVPGFLWLVTGLHTGRVGFTVEVHDEAPGADPRWEDIVEASYRPASAGAALDLWGGGGSWRLGLAETDYRVRYSAQGMDRAHDLDTRVDEEVVDVYLLQFWPSPPEPDRVVRQTSRQAAYWHRFARELTPPPPPPPSPPRIEAPEEGRP